MTPASPPSPACSTVPAPKAGVVRARDLLGEKQVLVIEHAGERYHLRLTRNGKLILTK